MDLNQLQIYPRVRNHWSAVDMGVRLARQWYKDLFWGWFVGGCLLLVILSALFFWAPWMIYVGFWWFKPLLDRLPLYIGSRKLFGQHLTWRQALKEGRPALRRDFFALLTWRRFSPSRSFDQPVTVLENLKGLRRQRRLQHLHNAGFNQSCWLTWVCFSLEGAGALAFYSLAFLMIPEAYRVSFADLMNAQGIGAELFNTVITVFVASAIAPFYVMGGFLLYLNRRIALEGWDIDLQFRALAQRLEARADTLKDPLLGKKGKGSSSAIGGAGRVALIPVLLMLGCACASMSWPEQSLAMHRGHAGPVGERARSLSAEIEPKAGSERAKVRQTMEALLSGEDFHRSQVQGEWQPRDADVQPPVVYPEWQIRLIEWLENHEFFDDDTEMSLNKSSDFSWILGVAHALEAVLWGALILLIGLLLYRYRQVLLKVLRELSHRPGPAHAPPATQIQGLDIRPETLPDDVPSQVSALVKSGDSRQALALLYRASLSRLAHRWRVPFAAHHTENECVNLVRTALAKRNNEAQHTTSAGDVPEASSLSPASATSPLVSKKMVTHVFGSVVALWTHCAYGHEEPDLMQLEQTLKQWPEVFDRG